ncbi:MAG TPA: hypothetical protein VGM39_09870 [Kofleriaceae bacterium]|jgi:hypothetical protein
MKSTLVCLLVCASACKSEKPAAQKDPWGGGESTAPAAATSDSKKTWYEADVPVGVWFGMEERMGTSIGLSGTMYLGTELKLGTYVVWPDGHFSQDMPSGGLADFDRDAWEHDTNKMQLGGRPGTWKPDGDGWVVNYATGGPTVPMKYNGNELTIGKAKLRRAADVTGARLDGVYTSFTDAEDPSLAGPGCQPLVSFTSDGKFDNRGGFALTCPAGANDPGRPGPGTYELRDFSLLLHYDDGRTGKKTLLGPLNGNLKKDNSRMVIYGQVWQRRASPIADATQAAAIEGTAVPSVATDTPPVAPTSGTLTTFDAVAFGTPPGKMDQAKSSVTFTTTDGDAFCMTSVFTAMPSTGKPDADFAEEWKQVILYERTADDTPSPQQGQTASGLVFTAGGSMTTDRANSARVYRALFVLEVGNRRVSVMFIAPTQGQLAGCKLDEFLKTVRGA